MTLWVQWVHGHISMYVLWITILNIISSIIHVCNMNMQWSSTSALHRHRSYMWQCLKKDWVKEGRQRDNYMESEYCSLESSLSLLEGREAVWRRYLFFIWRWKLKRGGESPCGITDWRCTLLGLLSLSSPSLPLPLTFHLPPFWSSPESCHCLSGRRRKRRRRRGSAHSRCYLCLPHSQTLFIPHSCGLQSSASLSLAVTALSKLSCVVLLAPPRLVYLYVGSIASYPSPPH